MGIVYVPVVQLNILLIYISSYWKKKEKDIDINFSHPHQDNNGIDSQVLVSSFIYSF